ncbi:MAG: hypothetical protein RL590_265, partial [Actinomycetota bacterium]
MKFRKITNEQELSNQLPNLLLKTLNSLEVESLIVVPAEQVIF